jgi:Protein of unknown function (DUF4242)
MTNLDDPAQCYLTEWYQPDWRGRNLDDVVAPLAAAVATLHAQGHRIRLLVTMCSPSDETVYCVFAAESADIVTQACRRADWPVHRITDNIHTRIP